MQKETEDLIKNILSGNTQIVNEKVKLLLKYGLSPNEIIESALNPAFKELGERMANGEVYVTDVLLASRAIRSVIYLIKPFFSRNKTQKKGTIVIGTVAGDLHDIGKDLVSMALAGQGYNVIDLGIDVTAETFGNAILLHSPDVLALSALLTTTMYEIRDVIDYIERNHLRDNTKILIGGAPVTAAFAVKVNADAYAEDLFNAVNAVDDLINNRLGKYSTKMIGVR